MFDVGCPRQILGRTTISLAKRITMAPPHGLHKAMCSSNGRGLAAFFGSMAFVCLSFSLLVPLLRLSYISAGSGKTVLSCVPPQPFLLGPLTLSTRSSIIEEIHDMRRMGLATISIFYFDFRDGGKQDVRHLLSSILIQLCDQSNNYFGILSALFTDHSRGSRQASEHVLMECLKSMLKLPGQGSLYLVIDALDECPNSSGYPTQREQVLNIMQELIDLQLPQVHFCITSRPEIDIRDILEPLAVYNVPLHKQAGQNRDIVDYINHFVRSDPKVRRWREEDKQLVIETLTKKAGGM
jgi:hypothetical protein